MNSDKIKALIIEDDKELLTDIKNALPDYFEVSFVTFSKYKEKIVSDSGDSLPGIIITNADDERALNVYRFIREDENGKIAKNVPVVLLTKDEFSDACMEFLSLGDPYFYEGEASDDSFYLAVTDAIENAEINGYEDDDVLEETAVTETKASPDKLIGKSFNVPVKEDAPMRIAALSDKRMLKAMESLIGKNKEKVTKIREVLEEEKKKFEQKEAALKEKVIKEKVIKEADRKEAPVKQPLNDDRFRRNNASYVHNGLNANRVATLLSDDSQGIDRSLNSGIVNWASNVPKLIKRIVVVDYDETTKKACDLFLDKDIEVVFVDSNMKAVDYFVKNTADIVMVEYDMPGVLGMSILQSIKMQKNGMMAKAVIMMSDKKSEATRAKVLATPGIMGIVNKPIVKKQLLSIINRCR